MRPFLGGDCNNQTCILNWIKKVQRGKVGKNEITKSRKVHGVNYKIISCCSECTTVCEMEEKHVFNKWNAKMENF